MRRRYTPQFQAATSGGAWSRGRPPARLRALPLLFGCGAVSLLLVTAAPAGATLPGPNGRIVFTSGRDDGGNVFGDALAQLWVIPQAFGTPIRVTDAAIQHRHATWSPDGTKLVYSAGVAPNLHIWILDLTKPLTGSNPLDITSTDGANDDWPSWSPDGTRVAYQSRVGTDPQQIVIQTLADGSTTALTQPPGTGDAGRPVWTLDSRTLYYSLVVNPGISPTNDDVYKKAADDTGPAIPVVTGPSDDYQPALSPDGKALCYTSGAFLTPAAEVMRLNLTAGATPTVIAHSGNGDYNCTWSPDGTKIAYASGVMSAGDLMVKNSDGSGTPLPLVQNVTGRFDGNPDWAPNPPPVCQNASVTVNVNGRITIPLTCVDPPPSGSVAQSIVSKPSHGTLGAINQNGVTYTPNRNFSGTDVFTFKGNDGMSDSNVATVRVTVKSTSATISSLTIQPSRFRIGSKLVHISANRAPVGTKISFSLSRAAKVKLTFAKASTGRKVGGRCVAQTKSNRIRGRCTRFRTSGTLSFNGHSGVNRVTFQGRISRTVTLSPGSYRLTVDATDSTGARSKSRTANFTIVAG